MSADTPGTAAGPVYAYPKEAVASFLAAADAERRILHAAIADADERTRRARAAVGMQRVMVSMLIETQRELAEQRAAAEREASEILAVAEDRAQQIVAAARKRATSSPPDALIEEPASSWMKSQFDEPDDMIDLGLEEIRPEEIRYSESFENFESSVTPGSFEAGRSDDIESGESDSFFAYLRGALADDEPLGPRFA